MCPPLGVAVRFCLVLYELAAPGAEHRQHPLPWGALGLWTTNVRLCTRDHDSSTSLNLLQTCARTLGFQAAWPVPCPLAALSTYVLRTSSAICFSEQQAVGPQ